MIRWTLTLTLRSPFATRSLSGGGVIDAPLARGPDGRVIVPGTLMRGLLRDAAQSIIDRLTEDDRRRETFHALFGRRSGPADRGAAPAANTVGRWRVDNEPVRRRLDVADLVALDPEDRDKEDGDGDGDGAVPTITRIALDGERGSVREGHLQVIELPFRLGREVRFAGTLTVHGDAVAKEDARWLLDCALALIPAVGAFKSAGFGQVAGAALEAPPALPAVTADPLPPGNDLVLGLTFDRPFLVDAGRAADNVFTGREVVPGGVLKGALAGALASDGVLDDAMAALLADLHVGHAWPQTGDDAGAAAAGWRPGPRVLPFSLALCGGRPVDLIACEDPADRFLDAPAVLAVDWKDAERNAVLAEAGLPPPTLWRDVRVRTAIDDKKGIARYDEAAGGGQLFAYNAVVPDGHVWIARLAVPAGADRGRLSILLRRVQAGVPDIGKTRATAHAAVRALAGGPSAAAAAGRQGWAVTLQTGALLNDLAALRGGRALFDDYAAYWDALGFTLVRAFACQSLVGGYLALRYPQRSDRYDPYLLTQAGSTFLVRPKADTAPDAACATLTRALRQGLPVSGSVARPDWRHCPFLPQNGYGAIAAAVPDPAA